MPPIYADAINALHADVAVLTEYMHDDIPGTPASISREPFFQRLGFENVLLSSPDRQGRRSNRVLISSNYELEFGSIEPPDLHGSFSTNALHVYILSITHSFHDINKYSLCLRVAFQAKRRVHA